MGCLAIVAMVLAAYLGSFFGGVGRSSLHPDTIIDTDPLPATTELAIFDAPAHTSEVDLDATSAVLSQRLMALGIEPDVRSYANDDPSIAVLLPGNEDLPDVISVLGQRGYFELVDLSGKDPGDYEGIQLWTTGQEHLTEVMPGDVIGDAQVNGDPPLTTILDSSAVESAELYYDATTDAWGVSITFTDEAAATLGAFSADHIGDPLGIVLDRRLLSAPVINDVIGKQAVIQGNFTQKEAIYLTAQIGSGILPIPLTFDRLS